MRNFVYDSEGNLIEDKSKDLKISYDWRGMPVEFVHDAKDPKDAYKLLMAYDGSGRRISKTRYAKHDQFGYWTRNVVTHYTGIGTEVRELIRRSASPKTTVVVNLPQGLGRYMPEDAVDGLNGVSGSQLAGYRPPAKFEWYLKNHLGSTMLVYGTQPYNDKYSSYAGGVKAAYDYRAFGERVDYTEPTDKITETFTGKELDDETMLSNHGARMLDPMLGMWISVDPKRFFPSPYLYVGNGYNPILSIDTTGNNPVVAEVAARAAIAAPAALYNMYQVQDNLAEQGASWLEMSAKGSVVLFTSLFINLAVPGAKNPIVSGMVGAATAATTNAGSQKFILDRDEINLNEVGEAARDGFMIGSATAAATTAASTQLLNPAAGFVGDAVGATTEILIGVCEDE